MFNNPFTPESKKAKKSLFKKELKDLMSHKIAQHMVGKIESITPLVEYGDFKIRREQIGFIYDLEKQVAADRGAQKPGEMKHVKDLINRFLDLMYEGLPMVDEKGNIQCFVLQGFKLTQLPESIGKLKHLQYLDLSLNYALKTLPLSLGKLKELKRIDLRSTAVNMTVISEINKLLPGVEIIM